jgi:hypothetical protein
MMFSHSFTFRPQLHDQYTVCENRLNSCKVSVGVYFMEILRLLSYIEIWKNFHIFAFFHCFGYIDQHAASKNRLEG